MLCEVITLLSTLKLADRLSPLSATGLNARVCACFFSVSKSSPACSNICTARSRWIQPSSCGCTSPGLSRTMSNMVLVLEFFTVAGLEVGVVDQDHGDLAAQVDAFEVVPVALRRLDAVTDEDQWGIADIHRSGAVHRGANGDLLALGQRLGLAAQLQTQRRLADDLGAQQGYGLCPQAGAVPEVATGLQAGRLHLRHHVVDGFRFSRGGRATTLEGIRGKRLDYIRQMPGAESRRVGRLRAGTGREDERGQEQSLHGQSPVWGTVFRY